MTGDWRREADDEWLDAHRSANFERLRRRLRLLGGMAEAMSNAGLGPPGGAPRRPRLMIGGRTYALGPSPPHRIRGATAPRHPGPVRPAARTPDQGHRTAAP